MYKRLTWVLIASLIVSPVTSFAGGPQPTPIKPDQNPDLRNVQLDHNGALHGQLVDQTGQPLANTTIKVHSQNNVSDLAATLQTDADGRFVVSGLKNGVVVVGVGEESFACRAWRQGTAPPKSLKSVALVMDEGQNVTRGQNDSRLRRFANGIHNLSPQQKACLGLLVAAAIVLPIALDDDDAS